MAQVYNLPLDIRNPELEVQPFTLFELMNGIPDHPHKRIREGECYVTGIQFAERGTPKFEELVLKEQDTLTRLGFSPEEINSMISQLRGEERLTFKTPLHAMRNQTKIDGCPYSSFLTNLGYVAIVHTDTEEVVLVPYDKECHRNLFLDVGGMKMADVRWQYDGDLGDALTEFSKGDYAIHLGKLPTAREYLEIKRKDSRPDRIYVVTDKNITLDKAINAIL